MSCVLFMLLAVLLGSPSLSVAQRQANRVTISRNAHDAALALSGLAVSLGAKEFGVRSRALRLLLPAATVGIKSLIQCLRWCGRTEWGGLRDGLYDAWVASGLAVALELSRGNRLRGGIGLGGLWLGGIWTMRSLKWSSP